MNHITNENKQSRMFVVRPLILTIAVLFAILLTPSYVRFGGRFEISAIIWLLRIEEDEPLQFFLTLDPIYLLNGFIKYLYLIIVFRYFVNQTTLKKALLFGVLIDLIVFVSYNFGNLLYILFPAPGIFPSAPREYPLPVYLLVFLVLALLKPHLISKQNKLTDDWLVSNG